MKRSWPPKLALALGGGAARGLAHLGVLSVLKRAGIVPDLLVGTSFGALVAGAVLGRDGDVDGTIDDVLDYVEGPSFRRSQLNFFRRKKDIEQTGFFYSMREIVRRGIYYGFARTRASFVPAEEFRRSVNEIIPDRTIEELPVEFAAVAADINTGEEVVFDRGCLRTAVQASCAIPGIMPPVGVGGGRTCIDGGWVNKVPAEVALALGGEIVVGVDVSDDLADTGDLTTGLNVVMRGDAIMSQRLKMVQLTRADRIIKCPLSHIDWADFPRAPEIIEVGRVAAESALPDLLSLLERASSPRAEFRRKFEHGVRALGLVRRRRPAVLRTRAEEMALPDETEESVDTALSGDARTEGALSEAVQDGSGTGALEGVEGESDELQRDDPA